MSELKYKPGDNVRVNKKGVTGYASSFSGMAVTLTGYSKDAQVGYMFKDGIGNDIKLYEQEIECLARPEFETGEEVLVDDGVKRIYLFSAHGMHYLVMDGANKRFKRGDAIYNDISFVSSNIYKIEEPDIEITVKLKGKEVALKDVSLETLTKIWEES